MKERDFLCGVIGWRFSKGVLKGVSYVTFLGGLSWICTEA